MKEKKKSGFSYYFPMVGINSKQELPNGEVVNVLSELDIYAIYKIKKPILSPYYYEIVRKTAIKHALFFKYTNPSTADFAIDGEDICNEIYKRLLTREEKKREANPEEYEKHLQQLENDDNPLVVWYAVNDFRTNCSQLTSKILLSSRKGGYNGGIDIETLDKLAKNPPPMNGLHLENHGGTRLATNSEKTRIYMTYAEDISQLGEYRERRAIDCFGEEMVGLLSTYVDQLGEEDKQLLIDFYIMGNSMTQMAVDKGIKVQTLFSKRNRALKKLRKIYKKEIKAENTGQ